MHVLDDDDLQVDEPAPRVHRVPLWLLLLVVGCCGVVTAFALAVAYGVVQFRDRTDLQSTLVDAGDTIATQANALEAAGLPAAPVDPSVASSITSAASAVSSAVPTLTVTSVATRPGSPPVTVTSTTTAPGATTSFPVPGPTVRLTDLATVTSTSTTTSVLTIPGPVVPGPTVTQTVEVPVEVPGPVVTVTVTETAVEPGPTVTVTVTPDPPTDPPAEPPTGAPTDQPTDSGE